jgi:ketopantoate reductase
MFNQVQNGVQKNETLLKFLPRPSVMGGVSYISAAIQEPGVIGTSGRFKNLSLENLTVNTHSERSISFAPARAPESEPA